MTLTAIDLNKVSSGYPLLSLSRMCGVSYGEMLNSFEDWATQGMSAFSADSTSHALMRWRVVLVEAFSALARIGVLRHRTIVPMCWPQYPPPA